LADFDRLEHGESRPESGELSSADFDRVISRFATGQDGNVGRSQLIAAGVSADGIDHRIATGAWSSYIAASTPSVTSRRLRGEPSLPPCSQRVLPPF